jgi:hypothetical protein
MSTNERAEALVANPGRNFITLKIVTFDGVTRLGDAILNGRELPVVGYLSVGLVMRRSGVRFPNAAPGRYSSQRRLSAKAPPSSSGPSSGRAPVVPPSRWAASHKLRSIMCPYRSIVMAAVACPSTR